MSGPGGDEGYQERFASIERAVDSGETDLRGTGFWLLVGSIKSDPSLSEHWADAIGRIDRKSFEARVRFRVPVWLGNAILILGTVVGAFAVGLALGTPDELTAGLALLFAGGVWSITVHDLAHWVSGRIVGISFRWYFLGGPPPPRPGLKTDYATYLRTPPAARAWMHASGAIATKLAPFVALAFAPLTVAPAWAGWALFALGVLQIVTDVVFSTKSSDWKKVRRELGIARARASAG